LPRRAVCNHPPPRARLGRRVLSILATAIRLGDAKSSRSIDALSTAPPQSCGLSWVGLVGRRSSGSWACLPTPAAATRRILRAFTALVDPRETPASTAIFSPLPASTLRVSAPKRSRKAAPADLGGRRQPRAGVPAVVTLGVTGWSTRPPRIPTQLRRRRWPSARLWPTTTPGVDNETIHERKNLWVRYNLSRRDDGQWRPDW